MKFVIEPLEHERDELKTRLNDQIDINLKANEQINLLRFKVEVLLEMLSIEEKKYTTTAKRLDALKWAIANDCVEVTRKPQSAINMDISGAMERMLNEFNKNAEGILIKFADLSGEIPASLDSTSFTNTLISCTSPELNVADIEVNSYLMQ